MFVISSYFSNSLGPVTNLSPTIRIWEVTDIGNVLLVGQPDGTMSNSDGNMVNVGGSDGFYRFDFTAILGFDINKTYLVKVDGGPTMVASNRYQTSDISPFKSMSSTSPWRVPASSLNVVGTIGNTMLSVKSDTTNMLNGLFLDVDSIMNVVHLLLKTESGRTKIDPINKTLTIFDEDCTTILRKFALLDSNGNPSVTDVCERRPIVKGQGDTTTITGIC